MTIKYSDSGFLDGADETKKLSFDVSGVTTGTTRTITMPDGDTKLYTGDGTSGQILTSGGAGVAPTFQAAAGGGKVLQVVSKLLTTQSSTSTSGSPVRVGGSSGMVKSITTQGTNSDFLVTIRWFGEHNKPRDSVMNIEMDGSPVNAPGTNRWQGIGMGLVSGDWADFDSTPEMAIFSTLVTTGSYATGTSVEFELTYTISSAVTGTIWTNRVAQASGGAGLEAGTSEIIITEIGA